MTGDLALDHAAYPLVAEIRHAAHWVLVRRAHIANGSSRIAGSDTIVGWPMAWGAWWAGFRRELGSIVSFHRTDSPSPQPQARYDRALARLEAGEVDAALAETMRLPGAAHASDWVARARRYIAAHRALDEIESSALLGNPAPAIATSSTR